jgi:hypothetical protein
MPAMSFISRRSDSNYNPNNTMTQLLISLVVLVSFALVLGGSLIVLRRVRKQRKDAGMLPTSNRNTRGLRTSTRDSTFVYSEKEELLNSSSPMPLSPESVPEIRITFPEEEDKETGRRISRVMVVEVGEAGVGFVRPLKEEDLPPYQQKPEDRFASVDLERIGGLKEKDASAFP